MSQGGDNLNRTYNFQVDNGLFVAEYYLNHFANLDVTYKDITEENLKKNVDIFSGIMWDLVSEGNRPSSTAYYKLATQSHNNSFLTQPSRTKEKLNNQLNELLDNVGNDKNCIICGEKRVNVEFLPDNINVFMYGIPSKKQFFNRANNLQTIDVCPICLFLSYISFLNTQKVSYPFLCLSNSDEFMRNITEQIQNKLAKDQMMFTVIRELGSNFTDVLVNIESSKYEISNIDYIDLIFFQNARTNYFSKFTITLDKLLALLEFKKCGLYKEFVGFNLFNAFLQDRFLINYLIDISDLKLKCTAELFIKIKEVIIMDKQIELVERLTEDLLEKNEAEVILKELKSCNSKIKFEDFILEHSKESPLYDSLNEFKELTERFFRYRTLLIANILLNKKQEV